MKSLRLLGAAIIAVLALGVIGVATAAAAPELGATSLPAKFTGTGNGSSELVSAAGTIACTARSTSGEFTTQTEGKGTMTFKGCTTEAGAVSCKTTGAASGEVVIPNAPTTMVSLKSGSTLVAGVLIEITPTLLIKCGVLSIEIRGSVLGAFPGVVNGALIDPTETKELTFKEKSGKQEYTTCEGGAKCGGTDIVEANFGTGFKEAVLLGTGTGSFAVSVTPTF